jgi:hypothetical protein
VLNYFLVVDLQVVYYQHLDFVVEMNHRLIHQVELVLLNL